MLRVVDIHVYISKTYVLKGVSLDVRQGEMVALIGANGAGKTTTLRTLSGLLRPRSGQILYRPEAQGPEHELHRLPTEKIVQMGISLCPEGRQVFSELTVKENLLLGAYLRRDQRGIQKDMDRIIELFPILGERSKQRAGSLSGGEQQMLAIGRALMSHPQLLMLDEPSLGLAPKMVDLIFKTLKEINQQGTTLLLVEQNAHMALELAQRAYVMETGVITLTGTGEELTNNERVRQAYLGIV